ncbi:hypothetical protein STAL104432_11630 [Streptomyces albus]
MVHLLQLPGPRGAEPDTRAGERLEHLGGQIGTHPHTRPERAGDLVLQLHQAAGQSAARVPLAQQLPQQLAVDLRAPRHTRTAHLPGDERARRLAGQQQPHPVRVRGPRGALQLRRVHLQQGVQRVHPVGQRHRARLEQGGLGVGLVRDRLPVGRHRKAVQPGERGRQRSGLLRPALVAQQQGFGRFHVVAPRHPYPGRQQLGLYVARRPPHPAADLGPGAYGRGCRLLRADRTCRPPVRAQRAHPHPASACRGKRPPAVGGTGPRPAVRPRCLLHGASVPAASDNGCPPRDGGQPERTSDRFPPAVHHRPT